ncbi:Rha family transcriptional regulator [Acinetobacter sp. B5B]|uniref:Rha family transcriptional regulator n=1 Tax=Acinetobacter baretiae TaxID=2605383 RepID=UPI0018C2965A|nr:Rha family transcriptional regulator [Acinetobacter baretiae]MBF7683927.1 Rha family transcriptional regulator [Acinetobacter baretiae]
MTKLSSSMVHIEHGQPLTTSTSIAERFNKAHKNILRDIEKLECSDEFRELNFELTFEINKIGNTERKTPYYKITRDGFAFLCMGFTGKEAARFKEDYINAFNLLESKASYENHVLAELNNKLKDRVLTSDLRYRKIYRYLQKDLTNEEIARCMKISTRMVRQLLRELRELEMLPNQEVFVLAHTGRISRVNPHQLGLEV